MKKLITSVFAIICVILCGITLACKFEIPQKISVKTKAEYTLNVGNIKKDLSETINLNNLILGDSIREAIPNAQVYDYFPGEENSRLQQYLIKLPLFEIPIDIGQYFENSNLSLAVQDLSFEKEIKIPSLKIEETEKIDLGFINEGLNKSFTFTGNAGSGTPVFTSDFTKIEYTNLILIIKGTASIFTNGTKVTVSNGKKSGEAIFEDNEATLNLGEFSFGKDDLEINFSTDTNNPYIGTIDENSIIKKAAGVSYEIKEVDSYNENMTYDVDTNITIPSDSGFESAIIADGTLQTKVNIPWEGVTVKYGLTTTDALEITEAASSGYNKSISLNSKTIAPGTINAKSTVTLGFSNATIDFTQSPSFSISSNIQKLSDVVVVVDGIETEITKEDEFPSEFASSVKSIILNPSGITGKYTNTLPEGNDIKLTVNSNFFDIDNSEATLSSGASKINQNLDAIKGDEQKERNIVESSEHNPGNNKFGKWDFNVKIGLPGTEDVEPGKIKLTNIKPNSTYKIGVTLSPELNWESVTIKPPVDLERKGKQEIDMNFADLFNELSDTIGIEDFGKKIEIPQLPIYLRAEKPGFGESFNDLKFMTYVSMFYSKDNGNTISKDENNTPLKLDLIGTSSSPDPLDFVTNQIDLEIKNNYVKSDLTVYGHSVKKNLANIVSQSLSLTDGSKLYIDYSVKLEGASEEGITIKQSDLNNTDATSIAVTAYIVLPIQFKVKSETDSLDFDLNKTLNINDENFDLFGRSEKEAVGGSGISDYTSVIQSCGLKYKTNSLPFYAYPAIEMKVKITDQEKTFNINGDTLIINSSDINSIFSENSYPYKPELKISIPPKATFSLQRKLLMDINVEMQVNTDGSIDILGGK